jgi:cation:H+ antiporter
MKDVPVMIGAAILVTLFAIDAIIGRVDAIILLAGCTAYLGLLMRDALQPPAVAREEIEVFAPPETPRPTRTRDIVHILGGVVGLVVGGRLLVTSASFFATAIGVSDLVIGLTVVAVGTSLPELATSVLAAFRGHSDLALGNVIGSNILNLLLILGTTALIHPLPAHPSMLTFEIPVMVGISILLVPLALRGSRITRWEGALLVVGYFVFLFVVVYKGQSTL